MTTKIPMGYRGKLAETVDNKFNFVGRGSFQIVYDFPKGHKFRDKYVLKQVKYAHDTYPTFRYWQMCQRLNNPYLPKIKAVWLDQKSSDAPIYGYCISEKLQERRQKIDEAFGRFVARFRQRSPIYVDYHSDNVMFRRSGEAVLNDPWAYPVRRTAPYTTMKLNETKPLKQACPEQLELGFFKHLFPNA